MFEEYCKVRDCNGCPFKGARDRDAIARRNHIEPSKVLCETCKHYDAESKTCDGWKMPTEESNYCVFYVAREGI